MKSEQATFLYVSAFIDELARAGLRHVVICPGSRSTPLALTFARRAAHRPASEQNIRVWMHVDERSAAFFALGMAKFSGQAVALVCTSGTAAANFMPAVVEAHYARVPLLILTADRPPELRDIGAPQTIDQLRLFGAHAKWFAEMPLPEAAAEMLRYARATANRAVAEAVGSPAGPVHLNFPFREPLVPLPTDDSLFAPRDESAPYTNVVPGPRVLDMPDLHTVAADIVSTQRGIIVCGAAYRHDPQFPAAVTALGEMLGFPVLADPLSGVRCGTHSRANVIDAYDAFLRDQSMVDRLAPQLVIRFGAVPTSKPLLLFLQKHAAAQHIVVDGGSAWNDAALRASHMIRADGRRFCEGLTALPLIAAASGNGDRTWLALWQDVDRRSREVIQKQMSVYDQCFEGRVFAELSEALPADGAVVYASSSMPVRDMDTFFPGSAKPIRFLANRGANGIDGVVSSALGASAISPEPLVLVIGDLAFYHDMNGLLAAKLHRLAATIVVVNNDGGGIFSFLPQAAHPEHFEQLFGTPHGLDFSYTAMLYGADYQVFHSLQSEDWQHFRDAVQHSLNETEQRLHIIEIRTDRAQNVNLHRQVWAAVTAALAEQAAAPTIVRGSSL